MGYKITVGKKFEGTSDAFRIDDGTYVFQIVSFETTPGRVKMELVTSERKFATKTFFMKKNDGTINEIAKRELSDFVTTAMQIEDEEVSMDISESVGYYVQATLRNSSYKNKEGQTMASTEIHKPFRADGFPDGTPSLVEDILAKREKRGKGKRNRTQAQAEEAVEEPVEKQVEEPVEEVAEETSGTDEDDNLLSMFGL